MNTRTTWLNGTTQEPTVGSYQMAPVTNRPYKVRCHAQPAKTFYNIEVSLTPEQAAKLCSDWLSMGGEMFRAAVDKYDADKKAA